MADTIPVFSIDSVYTELKRFAAVRMSSEAAGHTLGPMALVHEVYFRLFSGGSRQACGSPPFLRRGGRIHAAYPPSTPAGNTPTSVAGAVVGVYAGLTVAQATEVLGISVATEERRWVFDKAWLQVAMNEVADGERNIE